MKVIIVALCSISYCMAAEYLYNPKTYDKDSLESVNERVMERLRQEVGSERGIYHVYLPDGRLQRVQYTAAPLAQQSQGSISQREEPQGIYYVQVPEDRLQALRGYQATGYNKQKANQKSENYEEYSSKTTVAKERPENESQYLPITVVTTGQLEESVARNQEKTPAQGYVASIRYSQVEPVTGPIYSYSPKPLVRVLRYATYHL